MEERCECTTTMSQLYPNSGATNGDRKGEMTSVKDNGATNNNAITTTPQLTFHHLHLKGGIKFKLVDIDIIIYYGLK